MKALAILCKAVGYLIFGVSLVATIIWAVLITWTAFVGGQAPYSFIAFDGVNIIRGLIWFVIVDPILVGAIGTLVALGCAPFFLLAGYVEQKAR